MPEAVESRAPRLAVLSWAAFLACSWTWCIGMFLPVLLLRDFGPWAALVFAVPNVAGAALMGVALATPQASIRFVQRHHAACRLFSLVTLTFQCFFLTWLLMGLGLSKWGLMVLASVAVVIIIVGDSTARARRLFSASWLVYGASIACIIWWLTLHRSDPPVQLPAPPLAADLGWLAPVCFFGFLLCPYLDLSFHKARQALPGRSGGLAFVLGFFVFFTVMILFTFLYAAPLVHTAFQYSVSPGPQVADEPVNLHMGVQLAFTATLHAGLLAANAGPSSTSGRTGTTGIIAFIVGAAIAFIGFRLPSIAGLSPNEVFYRGFMAFYGLVFPAYVWLCVLPSRDGTSGPSRQRLVVLAVALVVAAPMFWLGFIQRETWWLAPGLGVVLLSRLAIRAGRAATPESP